MANDTDANKDDTPSSDISPQHPPATNKVDDMLASLLNWIPAPDSITQLMDEQRKSRLGQCRKLEQVLQECRESPSRRLSSEQRQQLEDFPMGIRMVRYFDWRDQISNSSCVREEHAVWACRAVSLQCGLDLVAVKECFRKQGPATVLAQPDTAYELAANGKSTNTNNNAVCKDLQQQLGACVQDKAVALEERMRSRGS